MSYCVGGCQVLNIAVEIRNYFLRGFCIFPHNARGIMIFNLFYADR